MQIPFDAMAYAMTGLISLAYSSISPMKCIHSAPEVELLPNPLELETRVINHEEVKIIAKATIELEAVVLCSSWARLLPGCSDEAALVPLDLGLGWRRMSDPLTRALMRIQQNYFDDGRRDMQFTSPSQRHLKMCIEHSSHMHFVFPPEMNLPEQLPKRGTPVYIKGLLVDLEWPEKRWHTDLTPGDDKCETVYLQRMIVNI
jgi:hypothetical protein